MRPAQRPYFYRDESLEVICKGIHALLEGELWMSRDLMARLILFTANIKATRFDLPAA